MVTYEEFKEQMRERAESEIGGRAIVKPVKKLNGVVLDGLSIMTLDSNISPTIYLNDYYLQYKNHLDSEQDTLDMIWSSISRIYSQHLPKVDFNLNYFTDWEMVKSRLAIRLINTEKNSGLLEEVANISFLDLSIIFTVNVQLEGMDEGSITVLKSHMEMWGRDEEELLRHALSNQKGEYEIISMGKMLMDMRGCDESLDIDSLNMFVLTNINRNYGASAIMDVELLEDFSRENECDKVIIIPSSVHETILFPHVNGTDYAYINDMISSVNSSEVAGTEVLSDHCYIFDSITGKITCG